MTYLIDTSALVRIIRRQTAPHRFEQVERGLVAICEPVLTEALTLAEAARYQRVEEGLLASYPWVLVPDDVWDTVRAARRELATHSRHQGLSVADYLVMATAMRHGLTVLHEDGDFETAARLLPHFRQERLTASPPGTDTP